MYGKCWNSNYEFQAQVIKIENTRTTEDCKLGTRYCANMELGSLPLQSAFKASVECAEGGAGARRQMRRRSGARGFGSAARMMMMDSRRY
jgi:hypothetical protein